MRALDTNVVTRFLIRDDPEQTETADRLMSESVMITSTVLLETVWVLASFYRRTRAEVAAALKVLIEQSNVTIPNQEGVCWAIDRMATGADFADMLHLADAAGADHFATFDRGVARKAGVHAPVAIETLA